MSTDLLQLLLQRRFWKGAWVWVVVLFVLVNVGAYYWHGVLLDRQRVLIQANFADEQKINADPTPRYDLSCGEELEQFWPSVPPPAARQRLAILSGMSQMHTIIDRKLGDELICQLLDDKLAPEGTRVWGFAAPNLSNEEAMFQLVSLVSDPSKKPDVFIYALCFDKMRNEDLRVGYQQFMRDHPEVQTAYAAAAHQFEGVYEKAATKMLRTLADVQMSQAQQSESFESHLRAAVGAVAPLVAGRKDLNGWAQIELLLLRNDILRIKVDSKRPMIQDRYDMNFEFLKLINDYARANGIMPIYYVIPLNPQAVNPYVPEEYERFKAQIQAYCAASGIPFANFENIVPPDEWGILFGGPDFKHFKETGHIRTAQAIVDTFGKLLVGTAGTPLQRTGKTQPAAGVAR